MTREAAMAKKDECPEDVLRNLVNGLRSEIPVEGVPGVPVIYRSSPSRIHHAVTTGPVEITDAKEVLIELETDAGCCVAHVRYGGTPLTWRFPLPSDPPPRKKAAPPELFRTLEPGEAPRRGLGRQSDVYQTHAEHKFNVI
jgi:hypothetical protein